MRAPRRPVRAGFAAALALGAAALTGASASGGAAPAKTGPSWETLPPSKLARTEVVAARAGGLIYVVGGFAGGGVAQSAAVERYDPRAREWTSTAPLPTTLNHAGAVGWRGDLYVFGGFIAAPVVGADRLSDRLFRYDAATDSWSELASAPVPRTTSLDIAVQSARVRAADECRSETSQPSRTTTGASGAIGLRAIGSATQPHPLGVEVGELGGDRGPDAPPVGQLDGDHRPGLLEVGCHEP